MASPRRLPVVHRIAPGVYYGWLVALGCALLSFVVVGIGFYGLVVFLDALVAERGWSRTEVSAATSAYWIVTGFVGIAIGRAVDRVGARRFLTAGVVLMAVSLWALGRIEAAWQVFPVYGLLAIGFSLAGSIPSGAIITRWFVGHRARAMMVAHTGVSLGGMVLVPWMSRRIAADGLAAAVDGLALLLLAVALPVIGGVLRFSPEPYGLEPDGGAVPEARTGALSDAAQRRVWSRRRVLATPAFWLLAAAFGGMLFCQVAFAMHELAFLRERLDPELAALAISATAGGSFVARIAVGSFADRVSKRGLAAGLFAFQAAAVALAAVGEGPVVLLLAATLFGFTVGNIFLLQSLLVGELFGMASFATVLGMLQLITQVTSGLGPMALGLLQASYGGYEPALAWLVGGALLSAIAVSRVVPPPE